MVGVFCTYFPQEIAMAMGACVVGLCSTSDETIKDAERDLPSNLCPLIKSSYGFALTDKCPFFYFSDLIVGETTCCLLYTSCLLSGEERLRARKLAGEISYIELSVAPGYEKRFTQSLQFREG